MTVHPLTFKRNLLLLFPTIMSYSPPPRRLAMPTSTSKHEEDLINAYEAEEERLVNIISRKLEKVRGRSRNREGAHEC